MAKSVAMVIGAVLLLACASAAVHADGKARQPPAAWSQLLKHSQDNKAGPEFYVRGRIIPGIVTTIGDDTVEVPDRTRDRIVIRLDRVDAIGS